MSLCMTVHVHDGLTLADQLLALYVTPKAMKSYFMTTYQGLSGDDGCEEVLWPGVF